MQQTSYLYDKVVDILKSINRLEVSVNDLDMKLNFFAFMGISLGLLARNEFKSDMRAMQKDTDAKALAKQQKDDAKEIAKQQKDDAKEIARKQEEDAKEIARKQEEIAKEIAKQEEDKAKEIAKQEEDRAKSITGNIMFFVTTAVALFPSIPSIIKYFDIFQ